MANLIVPSQVQFYVPFTLKITGLTVSDWIGGYGYGPTSSGGNGALPSILGGAGSLPGPTIRPTPSPLSSQPSGAETQFAASAGPWNLDTEGNYTMTMQLITGVAPPYTIPFTYSGPIYFTIVGWGGFGNVPLIFNIPSAVVSGSTPLPPGVVGGGIVSVSSTNIDANGILTVSGQGFNPNTQFRIIVLGPGSGPGFGTAAYNVFTNGAGVFSASIRFPLGAGTYIIQVESLTGTYYYDAIGRSPIVNVSPLPPPLLPPPTVPPIPPPAPTERTVTATFTVTRGSPIPTVIIQLVIDGKVTDTITVGPDKITIGQSMSVKWSVSAGHGVHVHINMKNNVGELDADSNEDQT